MISVKCTLGNTCNSGESWLKLKTKLDEILLYRNSKYVDSGQYFEITSKLSSTWNDLPAPLK